MKKFLIYGSADFALVIKDILIQHHHSIAGYIDDINQGPEILGTYDEIKKTYTPDLFNIIIGIGYKHIPQRWSIYQKVVQDGYDTPAIVHKNAYIRNPDNIGKGSIVMAGSIIDNTAVLGQLVVAWPGTVVNHDCHIGNNTLISPGVTICGFVKIGENSFIGAGSTITDHQEIPPSSFVKAGTLYFLNEK